MDMDMDTSPTALQTTDAPQCMEVAKSPRWTRLPLHVCAKPTLLARVSNPLLLPSSRTTLVLWPSCTSFDLCLIFRIVARAAFKQGCPVDCPVVNSRTRPAEDPRLLAPRAIAAHDGRQLVDAIW